MTDQPRDLLRAMGICRRCGSTAYTRRELNLHPGQNWRCYICFDRARGFSGPWHNFEHRQAKPAP
jgi:hypothetical protein